MNILAESQSIVMMGILISFHFNDCNFEIRNFESLIMYREMENVSGHVKFQNHYGQVHVQLSGNCMMWRSDLPDLMCEDGGWLSADVFVDIAEQKWHANLKIANLFAPVRYMTC